MLQIRIERRYTVPGWLRVVVNAISLLLAFVAIAIVFWAVKINPIYAYTKIFTGSFGSLYGLSETTVKAIPLLLCGTGLALAFKAHFWNIGAEGQLLMGAVGATWVALFFPLTLPSWAVRPTMFAAGFLAGALWALIPALLRAKLQVNEVITSLMLVYVAVEVVNYLVYGPWKGLKEWGFPYSDRFPDAAILPTVPGTRIHYPTLILGIVAAILAYFFLMGTKWGYELRVTGDNPRAAHYAGIPYLRVALLVMIISGGLAGMAGVGEVAGIHARLRYPHGISPGYGFTAIIVTWLAQLNPLIVILTSFLFGGLLVGGDALKVSLGLPVPTIHMFNGAILFFLIGGEILLRYRISLARPERKKAQLSP
ncbi:MAG: ABC transporter permease [Anaerolineae bacterium]|nr:ABC transporter permease [Anaerolineae bacterium]MDW8102063.1 ABC transporter permease [Anaerolineae bacterium]